MTKLQNDKNLTRQVRIDAGLHKLLRLEAAKRSITIKELLEGYIADGLDKDEVIKTAV
jgi:predicted HicB family RNase H-like nuclease